MGFKEFLKDTGDKITAMQERELIKRLNIFGFDTEGIELDVDGSTVTMSGSVDSQETREKMVLTIGNVSGISKVVDNLTVEKESDESTFHTVVTGDTLGAIAKKYYGSASKYPEIFDANKPMLTDPDRIYPGQVLRIPKRG